jgi:GH18 family chitinase
VLVSIGGAARSNETASAFTPDNVDDFVTKILTYLKRHNFDGLDVDVEGNAAMTPAYATFVDKLNAAVHAEKKLLTAALGVWFTKGMPDKTLAAFDFINIMSYDHCGPWTAPCEHATLDWARKDIDYFAVERGIAKDKLVLGVPFYAHCWGKCSASAYSYAQLLALHPNTIDKDWLDLNGTKLSWNGPSTIASKLKMSRDYGGMMIWEIGQDASGDAALLKLISGK